MAFWNRVVAEEKSVGSSGKTLNVIVSRCPKNHPCPSVRVCPVGALKQTGFDAPTIDRSKCINCGKCARFCPRGALVLK